VITTFDVIHDAVDPLGLLRTIRRALRRSGTYVCLDINCSDKLEENAGPLGALFHGFSVLYCMTTSLALGGAGLGTVGLPESKLRELSIEAGFGNVRRVPLDNPFNNLYELTRRGFKDRGGSPNERQLAESQLTPRRFAQIIRRIERLAWHPT